MSIGRVRDRVASGLVSTLLLALLLVPLSGPSASAVPGQLTPVPGFGSNPGNLQMWEWIPEDLPPNAPVVVVLHGCLSQAIQYDDETGMTTFADRYKFAMVYPNQQITNSPVLCFNWHLAEHQTREGGEPLSIKQMVDWMHDNRGTDPNNVYIIGFSGGGFFTSVMLATYPDVFKAGAIIAGGPYKCGDQEECSNGVSKTPQEWGDLARSGFPGYTGEKPRVSIWHGTNDTTVRPVNLTEAMKQWTDYHGIDQTPDVEGTVLGYPHKVYKDADGAAVVETYSLTDRAHGWPIDPGALPHQCNGIPPGANYGICASYWTTGVWFGLAEQPRIATALTYEGETRARGEEVKAAARLTQADGPPLAGAPVTFEIADERTTVSTDEQGLATATLHAPDHGRSQEVLVTYPGDETYEPAHTSATVTWGRGPK